MIKKLTNIFILLFLPVAACFYCLTTLIEMRYGYNFMISNFTKFVIIVPLIFVSAIGTKWITGNLKRKSILALTIVVIFFSGSISDSIFLGTKIAYTYLGQDAGFEELYLFQNGKSKITYGGIFGVTDTYYGTFNIQDSTVYIDNTASLLDLELHTIKLQDKLLIIKQVKRIGATIY